MSWESELADGVAKEKAGDFEGALDIYMMAMLLPDAGPEIELRMLSVMIQLARPDDAIAIADKLEAKGVVSETITMARANAWTMLSRQAREVDDRAAALEYAKLATAAAPNYAEGWFELGTDYKALGKLPEAIDAVARCVGLEPNQGDGWYNLACYRALLGNADRALEALGLAVQLDPENRKLAVEDPDFTSIRGDSRFLAITKE